LCDPLGTEAVFKLSIKKKNDSVRIIGKLKKPEGTDIGRWMTFSNKKLTKLAVNRLSYTFSNLRKHR